MFLVCSPPLQTALPTSASLSEYKETVPLTEDIRQKNHAYLLTPPKRPHKNIKKYKKTITALADHSPWPERSEEGTLSRATAAQAEDVCPGSEHSNSAAAPCPASKPPTPPIIPTSVVLPTNERTNERDRTTMFCDWRNENTRENW